MQDYFFKRLLSLFFALLGVCTLVFFTVRLIPGDPAVLLAGEAASPGDIENIRKNLNLNLPLMNQYFIFLKEFFTFSFGTSISKNLPVGSLILGALPFSLSLAFCGVSGALILAFVFSLRTLKNHLLGKSEFFSFGASILSQSIPLFVLGPVMVLVLSIHLGLLPVAGSETPLHLVLPSVCLSMSLFGGYYRYLSTSLINQIPEDYVRSARAKGLSENRIIGIHLLKNSSGSFLVVVFLSLGNLLGGAVVTETLFDWPGLGKLLFGAFQSRDFVLIQGIVVFTAFFHLGMSFLSDLVLSVVDPRIRAGFSK